MKGSIKLFVDGRFIKEKDFDSIKERRSIAEFWSKLYALDKKDEAYFEVSFIESLTFKKELSELTL